MLTVLVLAAGQGKRMVSDTPKILHCVGGKAIIHHVLETIAHLNTDKIITVISPALSAKQVIPESLAQTPSCQVAVQGNPRGTGDAVRIALENLIPLPETVMVICGDTPLLEASDLIKILNGHKGRSSPCLTIAGMRPAQTGTYGRIITDTWGGVEKIVEYRDATDAEKAVPVCNSGILVADGTLLARLVSSLSPQNEAGEYYLTDVVGLARRGNIPVWLTELPAENVQGINSRVDLATAEKTLQNRWRRRFMEQGVTLVDPGSVFFSHDTRMGRDITIYPNVTFGTGVTVGDRACILPGCHLEKAVLDNNVTIGPFAHLREGTRLLKGVTIGNFVEIKSSTLGTDAKAKHLSYLGNATIGEGVNIGAGTITCNHNGFVKSATIIEQGAYIGSGSRLVAPVKVGAGAIIGAGSVITDDVPADALGIARSRQHNKLSWAAQFRARFRKP